MRKILLVMLILMCTISYSAKSKKTKNKNSGKTKKELYFKNCKEARAAGYSNIRKGEPGYRPKLDRDGDGIACEN